MLRSAGIALSISVIFLTFSGQSVRAGWSDLAASLTTGASSPVLSVKKNKNDDDDDDNDHHGNDDHHNKKKKNTNDDTGLSECTIQGPSSGGGCKGGFKRVCEKLKSGKKCCGCVVDKNAPKAEPKGSSGGIKPVEEVPAGTILLPYFECDVNSPGGCSQFKEKK